MPDAPERCPICGGGALARYGGRPLGVCAACKSKDRTRTLYLLLQRLDLLRPGRSLIHFAPEKALAARLHAALGAGYTICDARAEALAAHPDGIDKRVVDLCDVDEGLAPASYDVVLHSHVMEHLRCSWPLAFLRLHALLRPGGWHLFAAPLLRPWSEEDLSDLPVAERRRRFGQHDHYRHMGRNDFLVDMKTVARLTDSEPLRDAASVLGADEMARIGGAANVFALRRRP